MQVLVTGGAGYIGSHAMVALARSGFDPVALDDLSEGHPEAVVAGALVRGSIADPVFLDQLFGEHDFKAVMHFASRCYVGESVRDPLQYYGRNVADALPLLEVLLRFGVRRFVFSSSCATYGVPEKLPLREDHPRQPVNPYGQTKKIVEDILSDCGRSHGLQSISLRYFNAAGASQREEIGESHDPETHLIPRVLWAALGKLGHLQIFGDDYPTPDGTAIRDFVHVDDLAEAHVRAVEWLVDGKGSEVFNLGSGRGAQCW